MSALQAKAAEDLLTTVGLSPQAKGKIAVLVADVPWATEAHRDSVMAAVVGVGGSTDMQEASYHKRRVSQN